ncbi:hypothetical protein ACNS7O_07485 [Haloferacaceae archaeon DSL9]
MRDNERDDRERPADGAPTADDGDFRLLGTSGEGSVAYYRPETRTYVETEEQFDGAIAETDWVARRQLTGRDELAELLSDIGDSIGWTDLSDYAREFVAGDDSGAADGTSDANDE